jgi:hypothetical protein
MSAKRIIYSFVEMNFSDWANGKSEQKYEAEKKNLSSMVSVSSVLYDTFIKP